MEFRSTGYSEDYSCFEIHFFLIGSSFLPLLKVERTCRSNSVD